MATPDLPSPPLVPAARDGDECPVKRGARPSERCGCGRPARVVLVYERETIPWCGREDS